LFEFDKGGRKGHKNHRKEERDVMSENMCLAALQTGIYNKFVNQPSPGFLVCEVIFLK